MLSDTLTSGGASLKGGSTGTNVQVAVRCRPLNAEEKKGGSATVVNCDIESKSIKVAYGPAGKKIMKNFSFDNVFGTYSRQEEVFNTVVRPIVDETLAGFNCTIFAYGQTGTGKTHTMEGDIHSEEDAGIVPRAVKNILEQLEATGSEFTIRVSFLELYNEELQDLLNTSGDKKLKLCEDAKKGVVCQNLEEIAVLSAQDILDILQRGILQRQTAATLCNKNSSRSHTIFTLKIMIKEYNVEGEEVVRHGQLNLVDLAGSECIGRSGAKNDRAREAGNINQSLLTLGRVITALVDHHGHVPYRDSKLTRLLQESLGGKAKTCIIATLSPSANAVEETMSTLDYAFRARNIKNQPTVNQKLTKKVIMKEYFAEIETLRTQLALTREKNGVYLDPNEFYAMETRIQSQESQLRECESALKIRVEENKALKAENEDLTGRVSKLAEDLEVSTAQLASTKEELEGVKDEVRGAVKELVATRAVVAEQSSTERALLAQAQTLSSQLAEREEDVRRLLDKVARLEAQEKARFQETQSFVKDLQVGQAALAQQLLALMTASEEQSAALGAGVQTMLTQGRTTCAALQQALGEALQVLATSVQASKDDMLAVLGELSTGLEAGASQSVQQAHALQAHTASWLDDTETCLSAMQRDIDAQQAAFQDLLRAAAAHSDRMLQAGEAFSLTNDQVGRAIEQTLAETAQSVETCSAQFGRDTATQQAQACDLLTQKASALQQTVSALMADFLAASQAALEAQASAGRCHSQGLVSSVHKAVDTLRAQTAERQQGVAGFLAHVADGTRTHASSITEHVAGVQDLANGIAQHTVDTTHRIGNKRKHMEGSTAELVSSVHTTVKKACTQVQYTSEAADQVLSKVSQASSVMYADSTRAMDSFTVYMDSEGQALREAMQTHFQSTDDVYQQQRDGLTTAETQLAQHAEAIETCVASVTGGTPRKVVVVDRPVYAVTRPHGVIQREARSREWSYLEAANTLQDLMTTSSRPSSASTSSAGGDAVEEGMGERVADKGMGEAEAEGSPVDENTVPSNVIQRSSRRSKNLGGIPVPARTRSNSSNLRTMEA